MTPAEHLAMAYPALADAGADVIAWALTVAEDYRPVCLSEERQNLAQAHYAAHLLVVRAEQQAASLGRRTLGAVIEEREGDLTVRYTEPTDTAAAPSSPYAAWKALNDICARGALVTRFG